MRRSLVILDFAGGIQGLGASVLHLDGAILEFAWPIQGFGHHILKFTKSKQFNAQEWCQLVSQLTRFLFVRSFLLNQWH